MPYIIHRDAKGRQKMSDNEQTESIAIVTLIRAVADQTKFRAEIAKTVWADLKDTQREELGRAQLRRLIAAELNDPSQLEFTIDGEPYPIEEVPAALLRRRGYRLIVAGEKLIKRGNAYLAAAGELIKQGGPNG
jgi:hypothetical protein